MIPISARAATERGVMMILNRKYLCLLLIIFIILLFMINSAAAEDEEEVIRVTGIRFEDDKTDLNLVVGDSEELTAIVFPYNAIDRRVTWENSNPAVADMTEENNTVTLYAKAAGETVITATTVDRGFSIECAVQVIKSVTSIGINPENLALVKGETAQIEAWVLPDDATEQGIIWESTRPGVVSVDDEGNINAKSEGEARIIARAQYDDAISNYTTVTVYADAVEENDLEAPVDPDPTDDPFPPPPEEDNNLLFYLAAGIGALIIIILILLLVKRSRSTGQQGQAVQQAVPGAPIQQTARPLLVGLSGAFAGQVMEFIDNQALIGRDPGAQAVYPPDSTEVSRKHCVVYFDPQTQQFTLIDISSNGTFWSNGERLEQNKQYMIEPGERFSLTESDETFTVELE